jgi:hypothetical protein
MRLFDIEKSGFGVDKDLDVVKHYATSWKVTSSRPDGVMHTMFQYAVPFCNSV